MLEFDVSPVLKKKLRKFSKKKPLLVKIFRRKLKEMISHDIQTINTYKNLRHPLQKYKRIHLTKNHILLFKVDMNQKLIQFADILHRDDAYK